MFAFGRIFEPFHHLIGDVYAGHFGAHVFGRFGRTQRANARQDKHLFVQPQIAHFGHEGAEAGHVKTVLGLDKLRPCFDFFGQPQRPPIKRRGKGIGRRPQKKLGWHGQFSAAQKHALVAQHNGRAEQLDAVQIEYPLCFGLVAHRHIIPRQAQHIAHPHRRRPQQIPLYGNAVAVAARDLEDGFVARPNEQGADGYAGHVAMCARGIGGVDAIAYLRENHGRLIHLLRVGAVGRVQLGRHRKPPRTQHPL